MNKTIIVAGLAVILVGGASFWAGMTYQKNRQQAAFSRQFGARFGSAANRAGSRLMGEILKADENSITVKLPDASSKIVLFSDKTMLNKAAPATKDDLKVGERVVTFGSDNPDGSVTATNIQLNPSQPTPSQ